MSNEFLGIAKACAQVAIPDVQNMALAGIFVPHRLFYKKSSPGKSGELFLVAEGSRPPNGAILAENKPVLHGAIPYVAYTSWICEQAKDLPILAL